MKKMNLEIAATVVSVAIFTALIFGSRLLVPEMANYGYAAALLIFVVIMGIAGLKLAEIPEKSQK